jgi:hypothetical protein
MKRIYRKEAGRKDGGKEGRMEGISYNHIHICTVT